jgi:hypothetical protein
MKHGLGTDCISFYLASSEAELGRRMPDKCENGQSSLTRDMEFNFALGISIMTGMMLFATKHVSHFGHMAQRDLHSKTLEAPLVPHNR